MTTAVHPEESENKALIAQQVNYSYSKANMYEYEYIVQCSPSRGTCVARCPQIG